MRTTNLDVSLAYTALFEHGALSGLTVPEGQKLRTELLRAWYAQDEITSLWDFTAQWLSMRELGKPAPDVIP